MIKLAIAAAALFAAGTTAYVVHRPASAPVSHAAAPAAPAAAVASAAPAAPAPAHVVASSSAPALPAPAASPGPAGPPDELRVDRATIERLKLHRGPARGPSDAPVTIVVYTDMLCSHCGNALGPIDQLWEEYPGKLRLVVKQLPVHAAAVLPAEAAFAADAQNKFWELHDLMLAHQDDLSRPALLALAGRAGLDVAEFTRALDQHSFAAQLEADKASAAELKIDAVPTFLINGRRLIGNRPVAVLRDAVDHALAE
jgi:protein-disulfide isomerase